MSASDYLGCPANPRGQHYSYDEAAEIVREAGVTSTKQYQELQRDNFRLPSNPRVIYADRWTSFSDFCGHHPKYTSYAEARAAARSCRFRIQSHYIQTYKNVDDRLHVAPYKAFKDEWSGWDDYLDLTKADQLLNYEDAKTLVRGHNAKNIPEYLRLRESHPGLPKNPEIGWRAEWNDWPTFLGREIEPYSTYWLAKEAVAALGIVSEQEYSHDRLLDPMLPEHPYQTYKENWKGWEDYLVPGERYPCIAEAGKAASDAGLATQTEYEAGYQLDPKLPRRPDLIYKGAWKTWKAFFSIAGDYYPNYEQARNAARALQFSTRADYIANHHSRDSRLPRHPEYHYDEWSNWEDFLDLASPYMTYAEAKELLKKNNIKTTAQYRELRTRVAGLPSAPQKTYRADWIDWAAFFGNSTPPSERKFNDFNEARNAARSHKFHTQSHYIRNCLAIDSRFRTGPDIYFKKEWCGWEDYLGIEVEAEFFRYEEAQELMRKEYIQSNSEYLKYRETEPRLPRMPQITWKEEWIDWPTFLGHRIDPYANYQLAKKATAALDIISEQEYRYQYLLDPMLPKHPYRLYQDDWSGWEDYVAPGERYASLAEARAAALALDLTTQPAYERGYSTDRKLPRQPDIAYKSDWRGWTDFCGSSEPHYESLDQARRAARALNFSDRHDYARRYRDFDTRLFLTPKNHYKEWSGWGDYLGTKVKNSKYMPYPEAAQLVQSNNVKTNPQYRKLRASLMSVPGLPSAPHQAYRDEWVDWETFIGLPSIKGERKYSDFHEARNVARSYNFRTQKHYVASCLKLDSRLHTTPDRFYKEWNGWQDYLGINVEADFLRYEEAKVLVRSEHIQSVAEYLKYREGEPRLPRMPHSAWQQEWVDWPTFLGCRIDCYPTLEQAKTAAGILDVTSEQDYYTDHLLDPMLPKHPDRVYANEWKNWDDYLSPAQKYATIEQASAAARALGFSTRSHYENGSYLDPLLPRRPEATYADTWQSWNVFYGRPDYYENFEQARDAARAFGFLSPRDYVRKCKSLDSRLYVEPVDKYQAWTTWEDYLGLNNEPKFFSLDEAMKFVKEHNIQTHAQYVAFRQKHPALPSAPRRVYRAHWIDWPTFLGQRVAPYEKYQQAKQAVMAMGLTSDKEYKAHYLDDPKLPKHPYQVYEFEWNSWDDFLSAQEKYNNVEVASQKACAMGFRTRLDYENGYMSDPMLPKRPDLHYEATWPAGGWTEFLTATPLYATAAEAAEAARKLGLSTLLEYNTSRHIDPRLPASPRQYYGDYKTWEGFILPKKCNSLADVKFAIKVIGIKDSKDYRSRYKRYPCLPAHPDRMFAEEWVNWFQTCDIPQPYGYEDATALLRKLNLPNSSAYKKYAKELGDGKFPISPDTYYDEEWVNWQAYLGKDEPYSLVTVRAPYEKWRFAIAEFMRTAKDKFKVHHLVMFVRNYVKPNNLSEDPITFFSSRDFDRQDYKEFLLSMPNHKAKQHLAALREFANDFLEKHMTAYCEDTSETVLVAGAVNHFLKVSLPSLGNSNPGQSTKTPLAYHHVATVREWIAPPTAASFSDLKHLHGYDNDWVIIDKSLIDENDPDCVFIEENGQYKIWFPGYWMHTYALVSVPIRGVQIAYADSGECDLKIPVMRDGRMEWIDNPSPLRGQTEKEGFIKYYPDGEYGMHLPTNKTSKGINGYDVPWMPEDLAKWMIRLRDWQSKYNPVTRPMRWFECENTNYSEPDRLAKGDNCFLFRDFGFEECGGSFGSRLYRRIAISLYNSVPELATMSGDPRNVSDYHSEFTPHAMRVSLVTAYVMDFRLPINVLSKIVGHASIIMTIYYVKTSGELLRQQMGEAEKRYMQQQSKSAYHALAAGRGDQTQHAFLTSNEDALRHLADNVAAGVALYRDFGICVTAATRCGDGSMIDGKRAPVPAGYLGRENCLHCRHLVTGPAFLGGLLSLANEISLCCRVHLEKLSEMQDTQTELRQKIKNLTNARFDESQTGKFTGTNYKALIDDTKSELSLLDGPISSASVKTDMYLSDLNVVNKLIRECQELIAAQADSGTTTNAKQLIVRPDHETVVEVKEVSYFRQLAEVCENAEIYTSASAEHASPALSNIIDKMAELNRLKPAMYKLDKKSQLLISNQIVKVMMGRIQCWDTVDAVMDGSIRIDELPKEQRLTSGEFQSLLKGSKAQDVLRIEYNSPSKSASGQQLLALEGTNYTSKDFLEITQ